MITYNHEDYIRKAIESVIGQVVDFKYEFIICDDHSSDNTTSICLEYKKVYPDLIKYTVNPENMGFMKNFLQALNLCDGKYIALLEGDDYWTFSNKLQRQVDFMEANPDYSLVCHDVRVDGEIKQDNYFTSTQDIYSIQDVALGKIQIPTLSILYRKECLKIPEYFKRISIGDFPLIMEISRNGKIKYFPEVMGVRTVHNSGVWSSLDQKRKTEVMLRTLSVMTGNFSEEINSALLALQLKIIANSLNDNILPDFYPSELKAVAKRNNLIRKISIKLKKIGLLRLIKLFFK